jgi:hypothetical protein
MKKPSKIPGAINDVTARISDQCITKEIEISAEPATKSRPNAISAGRIPSATNFGNASVSIVRDGA